MNDQPRELANLREFLDQTGLGRGAIEATPIGDGHSNITLLVRRTEGEPIVLRRPPRGTLAPSANDVVREARLLEALAPTAVPVPEILKICEDPEVIGAPFYLMSFIDGQVLIDRLPARCDPESGPPAIATALVDSLIGLHAVDVDALDFFESARRSGYLDRQLRRFRGLLEHNATRPLPGLEQAADWLEENKPTSSASALVHGDYRLGNVMYSADAVPKPIAVLDWEMSTIGDPLADLGYLTAAWAEPGDVPDPLFDLSRVTQAPGFPGRAALAHRYAAEGGTEVQSLPWYQVLALWKAAIFLEGSYGRYLAGASADAYFARLERGVLDLADRALTIAGRA